MELRLGGDEASDYLNFVVKDEDTGTWYDLNGTNFQVCLGCCKAAEVDWLGAVDGVPGVLHGVQVSAKGLTMCLPVLAGVARGLCRACRHHRMTLFTHCTLCPPCVSLFGVQFALRGEPEDPVAVMTMSSMDSVSGAAPTGGNGRAAAAPSRELPPLLPMDQVPQLPQVGPGRMVQLLLGGC